MKTYKFLVSLCGGWCNGTIEINAENEDEAYDKAMDFVVDGLVKAFPTLDIDYDVECKNPDEKCEYCNKVISENEEYEVFREDGYNIYCCEKCLKEKFSKCESCGEYFLREDLYAHSGGVVCADCYDEAESWR